MARTLYRLSARAVATVKETKLHADGGGLYLDVKESGAKSWTFIYRWNGKRRETGLGAVASVSLASAREKAAKARAMVADGIDPKEGLKANGRGALGGVTFGEAADALVSALESGWKNPKHRQQWRNTLKGHCGPIWTKPVGSIDVGDVLNVLNPIWRKTPETAQRLRGRIERVLGAAKAQGQIASPWENPARWRDNLQVLLPARQKSTKRHQPAMPYKEVGEFVKGLKLRVSTAARALEFLILTAARTTEVLEMRWREVDLDAGVWTVPAGRMKMGIEHRVALSDAAIIVLRAMAVFGDKPDEYVFPSRKPGRPLSNMSMAMLMRRMDFEDYTVHGFRSSFRDWAGEETDHPRELAEMALAHAIGDEVERAYRRGSALEKRRSLMQDWSEFVMNGEGTASPSEEAA